MIKKIVITVILVVLMCHVFGIFDSAKAQAQDQTKKGSAFSQAWEKFKKHSFVFSISIVTLITIISTVMAMVRKDKILKSLAGHLVTIEQMDGERYRGRLRVESEGIEVIAEKAKEDSNEKVSYILRKDEMSKLHALVRYHDLLTDKEKQERDEELRKVYHPSINVRLRRKARNVINEVRRVATEAFTLVFGKVRKTQFIGEYARYGEELETTGKEVIGYITEAAYDALIDKLIGTRVVVRTTSGAEYIGVLKDYTSQFIELMNVDYKSGWQVAVDRDENYSKHDRGLIMQRNGSRMVISSKSPFDIVLRSIAWREGPQDVGIGDANTTILIIPPFGRAEVDITPPAFDRTVEPFERLQVPVQYSYGHYKKIIFSFGSTRTADIVMLKSYGIVRHRTEKYEPKLLDISTLTDALLITKDEGFLLKGNPTGTPLNIHNGHLTNLPKERMDVREVDEQISQRWAVEESFHMLDNKVRPVPNFYFLGSTPLRRTRKVRALFALLAMIHADEKRRRDPLLPLIYMALYNVSVRKKQKLIKNQMLKKKWAQFFRTPIRLSTLSQTDSAKV